MYYTRNPDKSSGGHMPMNKKITKKGYRIKTEKSKIPQFILFLR